MTVQLLLMLVLCSSGAWLISRNAAMLGATFSLLDYPDPAGGRKRHARVTPLLGGSAVILPVLMLAIGYFLLAPAGLSADQWALPWLIGTTAALYLLGVLDDRFDLPATTRLAFTVTVLAACIVNAPDFQIFFVLTTDATQPWLFGGVAVAFTLLCLVGLINAVNMADGKNGLVIGMCLIWSLCLLAHAPPMLVAPLAALALCLAVVLAFNLRGLLFLGDGGSYGISTLIGLSAIYVHNVQFIELRTDQVVTWFLVPVLDCLRLMTTRMLHGRSPFAGDREHLHHYLARAMGWPGGLLLYWLLVGMPCLATFLAPEWGMSTLVGTAILYAGVVLLFGQSRSQALGSEAT